MYLGLYVKYSLFLSRFNKTWIFSTDFRKICNKFSWKSFQLDLSFFHCDRQLDGRTGRQRNMARPIVAFRNFSNIKISFLFHVTHIATLFKSLFISLLGNDRCLFWASDAFHKFTVWQKVWYLKSSSRWYVQLSHAFKGLHCGFCDFYMWIIRVKPVFINHALCYYWY